MPSRHGHARYGFEGAEQGDAETIQQINGIAVVKDHPGGLGGPRPPGGEPALDLEGEGRRRGAILAGALRVEQGETLGEFPPHLGHAHRVHVDVRVADRMDITQGAVGGPPGIEQGHLGGGLEITAGARQHLGVGGVGDHRGQPADLQIGAHGHEQIRPAQGAHHGRFDLEGVEIAVRARQHLQLDALMDAQLDTGSRDLAHQGPQTGTGGHHLEVRRRGGQGQHKGQEQEQT